MFWSNSSDLLRVLILTPLAYAALIVILRISGKRMLSQMSEFDFVVTVAIGSTLATIVLSKDVVLVEGLAALAMLILLQYLIAWLGARSQRVLNVVQSEPTLLFFQGRFLRRALHAENVSEDAVRAAMRAEGFPREDLVEAVVLEANGSLSVLPRAGAPATTLQDVSRKMEPGNHRE